MTVVFQQGNVAGERWNSHIKGSDSEGKAFWVRGKEGTLESHGFASCVGLVLYGDVASHGAVAHFWNPTGLAEAKQITEEYMRWLYAETGGYAGDDVQALVCGGTALGTDTGTQLTEPRIAAIKDYLETRWDMYVEEKTVGSKSVYLDLGGPWGNIGDRVRFQNGSASSKPHESFASPRSKTRRNSGTFGASKTSVTRPNRSGSFDGL